MTGIAMGPAGLLAMLAAAAAAGLIVLLRPLLVRYALARPSARGLHSTPTPQGGGIAVLLAAAAVALVGAALFGLESARLAGVLAGAFGLAVVGLVDDIRPLPALPRLGAHVALMAVGVALLPEGTRVLPFLPHGLEYAVLVLAGAWFVNLTNFMDGMDWITVADMVPVSGALTLFWLAGDMPASAGLAMLGLFGGMIGYAPFNKPVARLFLGDVGSLPIGFMVAYGLFSLAGQGGGQAGTLAAAVLLPLYPIADSGLTLLWRLRRGEAIWKPHRSHFYQVAVLRGLSVWQTLARIAAVNMLLALLAWAALRGGIVAGASVLAGLGLTAMLLVSLRAPHQATTPSS